MRRKRVLFRRVMMHTHMDAKKGNILNLFVASWSGRSQMRYNLAKL
jgi:hypothetical protein